MIDPNASAFPEVLTDSRMESDQWRHDIYSSGGLTKREHFAAMALPAIIQTCATDDRHEGEDRPHYFARRAIECADCLIAALNKGADK